MKIQLPSAIATFFKVSNGADAAVLSDCLIIRDDEQTYQGLEAIEAWHRAARLKYKYTVEPLTVTQDGVNVKVLTQATGDFPGSPAQFEYLFQLADDKIEALEIR